MLLVLHLVLAVAAMSIYTAINKIRGDVVVVVEDSEESAKTTGDDDSSSTVLDE